ncbi:DUF6542 domain-containing protein [Nonomuraea sp. 3-1Str]|uniref:DUF6542 domain-containing protein n=1 Tax=unclassified Nonomuraea TaxID=2593643 RepID=UPI002855BC14|nr:DUF6542 domain-containing protein [Nonomuraea sp. 3-1Str]MDR8410026.1 hypothetical protein [Nonomuraea sp. 3-1Str]
MSEKGRRSGVRLTARGAIVLALAATVAAYAVAWQLDLPVVVGVVFVAASLLGALLVNRRELLSLVVTPPLVFFAATLVVELVHALGSASLAQSLALGLYTSLSAGAPWLFAGSAVVLGVALRRGLRDNVRELREELRAGAETARPSRRQAYAPEPEGYFEPRVYGSPRTQTED